MLDSSASFLSFTSFWNAVLQGAPLTDKCTKLLIEAHVVEQTEDIHYFFKTETTKLKILA